MLVHTVLRSSNTSCAVAAITVVGNYVHIDPVLAAFPTKVFEGLSCVLGAHFPVLTTARESNVLFLINLQKRN